MSRTNHDFRKRDALGGRLRRQGGALCVAGAILLASATAQAAEVGWSLASRQDSELVELVRTLEATPAPMVDAMLPDADAVCLTHERILQLEESRYRITENVMYRVLDTEGARVGSQQFRFTARSRIDEARAWIVRGDRVVRCPENAVTIVKGNGSRPTEVIIAVPGILDGDVIGWSFRRSANWAYPGTSILLQEPEPTRLYTLRLLTDGLVAYRIMGRNLRPDTFTVNVLERRNGTETHTLAEFRDLVAQDDGPYAPPAWATAPTVSINWRGYLDTSIGTWFFNASWSEAAVWMESVLDELVTVNDEVRGKARELTAGLATDRERLAALHDFVRSQVVTLEPGESFDDDRPADEVLASRTASPLEAGALLCALAEAVAVPVRPVFARSLDLGPIDNGNPSLQQFSELLVEFAAEPGCYAAPARRHCPLGTLPDDLLGGTALVLADDLAAQERAAIEQVFSSNDKLPVVMARYHDHVARLPWQTMFTLPGNAAAVSGSLVETMTAVAGNDTVAISLAANGRDGFLSAASPTDDPADLLSRYCEERLPTAKVARAEPRAADGALGGAISLDLGRPAGETWLIPSESVFGAAFLAGLELPATDPVHIDVTRDFKRVCRVKLPPGWRLAMTPPALNVTHPLFVVSARLGAMDGELVVIREIRLRRGTTPRGALAALEEAVNRVRAYEQTPLVLVRSGPAAGQP